MLSKKQLLHGLKTKVVGKKLFVFESIDSTNACAKTLAETGTPEGTVVLADHQTFGRGRLGRTWVSEPGRNLLFSLVLRPPLPKESAGFLTFFSAVFIAQALEQITGHDVECKWPNDILINGKKCCGILLENSYSLNSLDYSVVGIGINVNQRAFDGDLDARATSLAREFGAEFDRAELFRALLEEADRLLALFRKRGMEEIMKEWNRRCNMFGKPVTVSHGETLVSGMALSLDADGGLIIQTAAGQSTFYAGDVTVLQGQPTS
ncbi:MAG TPA: biotin--[acetyl-CoA-carboxylase] ligase [Bacteroidota bacterium]|nr:biotin--[acetyl-CoA-carboxylase] ligase [Bacteroidota bacterium]